MLLQGRINKTSVNNQKGQAVIEYVLLLLLTLILLGGVVYQFNTAFKVFADSWFVGEDSYIACAIRNGILPDGSDEEEVCTRPRFDITKGVTKNGQGIGADGKPLDQNSSQARNSAGGKNAAAASGGRAGARRVSDGQIGVVPFNSADAKNTGLKSSAATKADGDKASTGNSGFSSTGKVQDFEQTGTQGSLSRTRSRLAPAPEEAQVAQQTQNIPLTPRDLKTAREIAAEKKKRASAQEKGFELSIGNVFKYIIIALLVFSIIFFLGSQLVAVARSKKRK
ncbi:MAG: hypothetical protein IPM57_03570 [Oligoflexia bacterium]|nr:hypothetical protein [Oligoflexia bacterium]